jgi:ubiquinone/menaquinone biosynthesis C-methylase UbiE
MSLKVQAWDAYWENNSSLNSFTFDYSSSDGPYRKVSQFWLDVFAKFTSSDTIVDLGAGNGALAHLFLQSQPHQHISKWINIDSATATNSLKRTDIVYQQDDMCHLSLPDSSVDHFVSMFGVEYADFSKVFPHLHRCIAVGGNFHFILHHEDSVISNQSRITINVIEQILASPLFRELAQFSNLETLKSHLLGNLNHQLNSVAKNAEDDVKIIGQRIYNIIQLPTDLNTKVEMISALKKDMYWHLERLQQQLLAAQQVNSIEKHLQKHNFMEYSLKSITHQSDILGWSLTGTTV